MNINLTLLSVVGYCLCIAVVEHAALKDEETGPDKNIVYDRITFCYETLFECLQGSEVNFGCRTRYVLFVLCASVILTISNSGFESSALVQIAPPLGHCLPFNVVYSTLVIFNGMFWLNKSAFIT